jgi:DNA mismatch endonuclease (patch repair protein)
MADFLSPAERSERMSRIRGKDSQPELALRRVLHRLGLRYRLHVPNMPGKPDLVFPRHKAVVFVHGCFWHRHAGCNIATIPKTNTPFWLEKFEKNVSRDARNAASLRDAGWRVFVVWECELASDAKAKAAGERLALLIRGVTGLLTSDKQKRLAN